MVDEGFVCNGDGSSDGDGNDEEKGEGEKKEEKKRFVFFNIIIIEFWVEAPFQGFFFF